MDSIHIFDTTLRDGEQAPGFSMNRREKLEMARQLARLRVDVIEAGFPSSSPEDFASVEAIARRVGSVEGAPIICGLARTLEGDITRCAEALAPSRRRRIHTFIATSEVHMREKLRMSSDRVLQAAVDGVRLARSFCPDVEFSPEDASRTDFAFLCEVLEAAIEAGATTVNIPDTVGYATPHEFAERISSIRERVKNIDRAIISVHCHDDLGMAVANSLAAVTAGARQIECALNGIGERAGNASLEEVVMALHTRADSYGVRSNVETRELYPASRLLSHITGVRVAPNKAIVGENAFAHEAGIHQHGMLAERTTYEIMRTEDVGRESNPIVLGKHSGRHALAARLTELGFELDEEQLSVAFTAFKKLADKKKKVYDDDLFTIARSGTDEETPVWELIDLQVLSGTSVMPTASVRLVRSDREERGSAIGDGPIDAAMRAVEDAVGVIGKLRGFTVHAATPGKDAIGGVAISAAFGDLMVSGRGHSTDIVEASARAWLDATNRAIALGAKEPTEHVNPVDAESAQMTRVQSQA